MYRLLRNTCLVAILAALVLPSGVDAQLRPIVAKSVAASSSGASLDLSFRGSEDFQLRLEDGDVFVDGASVGTYEPGGALDTAWRALLGEAMGLENGALAERLVAWEAPEDAGEVGRTVDEALESGLRQVAEAEAQQSEEVRVSAPTERILSEILTGSVERLSALGQAMENVRRVNRIHLDEDVVIAEGTVVDGGLVVIDGTLTIEGEVDGDVVVVDGAVEIMETGVVRGELRVADARILRNRGEVSGGIVDVLEDERSVEDRLRDQIRQEIQTEVRNNLRHELREVTRLERDDGSFSLMTPFRPVIRGVGGVLEKLILIFVLGLVGAGFLAFAGENMETISETARRSPGRAAMVGVAGSFLLLPVWILGAIALLVSIVGIPVAIAWLPLFPLAAGLAALLGYLAVAQNTGEWLAKSDFPWTGWIERSNPLYTLVAGLIGLLLAFMAGHVISIAPFLDFLGGLLFAVGVVVTVVAIQIGFGAVLLTRGGRRREYYGGYDPDAAWEAAIDVDMDLDVDDEPGMGAGTGTKDDEV